MYLYLDLNSGLCIFYLKVSKLSKYTNRVSISLKSLGYTLANDTFRPSWFWLTFVSNAVSMLIQRCHCGSAQNTGKINIYILGHYQLISVENLLSISLLVINSVSVIPGYNPIILCFNKVDMLQWSTLRIVKWNFWVSWIFHGLDYEMFYFFLSF